MQDKRLDNAVPFPDGVQGKLITELAVHQGTGKEYWVSTYIFQGSPKQDSVMDNLVPLLSMVWLQTGKTDASANLDGLTKMKHLQTSTFT